MCATRRYLSITEVRDRLEVRQVMIPKASGKLHKLGIPMVTDRVGPGQPQVRAGTHSVPLVQCADLG